MWIKQLENELQKNPEKMTKVYCDNESTIKLAECDGYRPRTKHIDIRFHHIRQQIENGTIKVEHISTTKMVADSLTKAVTKDKHHFCTLEAGLHLE